MNRLLSGALLLGLCLEPAWCSASHTPTSPTASATLFVAPHGQDDAPGTREKPLRSPAGALRQIAERRKTHPTEPLTVLFAPGTYPITHPLRITPQLAGEGGIEWVADAGEVTWTGALPVEAVARVGDTFEASLPPELEGTVPAAVYLHQQRLPCARFPIEGELVAEGVGNDARRTLQCKPGSLPQVADPHSMELVYLHHWTTSRVRVARCEPDSGLLSVRDPIGAPISVLSPGDRRQPRRFVLENAPEFLNPGTWCATRDRLLIRIPASGPPAQTVPPRIALPGTDTLVRIEGTPNRPVRGVFFQGITLTMAGWKEPPEGYRPMQATFSIRGDRSRGYLPAPAAIRFEYARDCGFLNGHVRDSAAGGIAVGPGCSGVAIEGNRIERVGGNGISLGPSEPRHIAEACRIERNVVRDCGWRDPGAVGIWVGFGREIVIRQNRLERLPYTGISLGWEWSFDPTGAAGNLVERNLIQQVLLQMDDGGGIYVLGHQPGTAIRENLVRHIPPGIVLRDGRRGIYLDEGSSDILVERNVVMGVANTPFLCHKADRLRIVNNFVPDRRGNLRLLAMRNANVEWVGNLERTPRPPPSSAPAEWQTLASEIERGVPSSP